MPDDQQTINDAAESSTDVAPISEFLEMGDLVSTVEAPPQKIETVSDTAEQNTEDAEDGGGTDKDKDDGRFDKHPRFQSLIQEKNDLKTQLDELRSQVEGIKKGGKDDADDPGPQLGFEDITSLEDDAILDKFNEGPKEFLANFARQVAHEVQEAVAMKMQTESHEDRIAKTFQTYAEKNPDFDEMWESGELKRYMDENPGHNAISAHQILTSETRLERAKREAEEKTISNIKTKKKAQTLSSGPGKTGKLSNDDAPELKDPKKFGGVTSVLADRLKARRLKAG